MLLKVDNLVRHFGKVCALDGVSLGVRRGEVLGLVGPNGAGKTTAMRIIATLDEATAGDVMFHGTSLLDYPEVGRRGIGFMPDDLPAHADITVHEYIDFFARAFGFKGSKLRQAVANVEEFTGLGAFRDQNLKTLSKGMKQRVSLARALVHDPEVLVMDEPANGLDPRARIELRELVKALADNGKAVLISSHILSELGEMCSDVAIIERGLMVRGGNLAVLASDSQKTRRIAIQALAWTSEQLSAALLEMSDVISVLPHGAYCVAELRDNSDALAAQLLRILFERGIQVLEFRHERADLEDIFMQVTKGELA